METKHSRYYTYIKPVLKNKTVKTYSSLIFSLITTTIFLIYAIRPTLSTIISLQKSINEQSAVLTKLNQKVKDLTEGRKNYESIDPTLKVRLVDLLPYSPSLPSLMNSLTILATESQSTISGLQFQPVILEKPIKTLSKDAALKEVDFTFNAQGSYSQLINFLNSLKRADRLINISSISFNKPLDAPLIMTVNAKSLYLKNEKEP